MAVDRELIAFWKRASPALDPWLEIEPDAIERLYQERADRPSRRIATDLLRGREPAKTKLFLCGSRGSGKSTELRRLAFELREDFVPLVLDAGQGLPRGAGTLPLVILVGLAGLWAMKEWRSPDAAHGTGQPSLREVLAQQLQVALDGFAEGAVKVGDLVTAVGLVVTAQPDPGTQAVGAVVAGSGAALKAAGTAARGLVPSARVAPALHSLGLPEISELVPPEKMGEAEDVVTAVNQVLTGLEELAGRPVLVLVEGLDKLDLLDDVFKVIQQPELLDAIAAPMVLTGPVSLRHSVRASWMPSRLRQVILPNLSVVRGPPDQVRVCSEGIDFLLGVYARRIDGFAGVPKDLVHRDDLARLARASSGVVREFLLLLDQAVDSAIDGGRRRVSTDDVTEAIRRRRIELQYALDDQRLRVLGEVLASGTRPEGAVAEELLYNNFIACYGNGNLLYRPHEVLIDYVKGLRRTRGEGEE